jgi:hypothetical protein
MHVTKETHEAPLHVRSIAISLLTLHGQEQVHWQVGRLHVGHLQRLQAVLALIRGPQAQDRSGVQLVHQQSLAGLQGVL